MVNNEKMKVADDMFALVQKEMKSEAVGTDVPKDARTGEPMELKGYNVKTHSLFHLDDFSISEGKEANAELEQFVNSIS